MKAVKLDLDVSYAARRPWVPRRSELSAWARAALRESARTGGGGRLDAPAELSVRVVGRARSQSLNTKYRSKLSPTNVLSFQGPGATPDGMRRLGELVICAPVVAREAAAQGKALKAHWAHLTVHGVLHLLGFDHEAPREAAEMEAAEVQILDRLGFSDPYR